MRILSENFFTQGDMWKLLCRLIITLYYAAYRGPTIRYGTLVYGCRNKNDFLTFFKLRKKALRSTFPKKKSSINITESLLKNYFLNVFDRFKCELTGKSFSTVNRPFPTKFLCNLFKVIRDRAKKRKELEWVSSYVVIKLRDRFRKCWMPKKRTASSSLDVEGGCTYLNDYTGEGRSGKGCVACISMWLPKTITKDYLRRHFLCGFRSITEIGELRSTIATPKELEISTQLNRLFNANYNEQYGQWLNVKISGVKEEVDEDVYQKVFDVVAPVFAQVLKEDISTGHWVPRKTVRDGEGRPTISPVCRPANNFMSPIE